MASIKCGKCSSVHSTVAEVRACYAGTTATKAASSREAAEFGGLAQAFPARRPARRPQPAARAARTYEVDTTNTADPFGDTPVLATERQIDFALSLQEDRTSENDHLGRADYAAMTKDEASKAITYLLTLPRVQRPVDKSTDVPRDNTDEVPAGRYAIDMAGTVKFYRVDRPTEGRWAGRTFVKVQASDDLHPVRGNAAHGVLSAIATVGPREASLRYGREIGSCGVCGRTLTDEASRAAGIGPICASKKGW